MLATGIWQSKRDIFNVIEYDKKTLKSDDCCFSNAK